MTGRAICYIIYLKKKRKKRKNKNKNKNKMARRSGALHLFNKTILSVLIGLSVIVFPYNLSASAAEVLVVSKPYTEKFSPEAFLSLTNDVREAQGILPLVINDELNKAAEAKALDMMEKNYWDHFRPSDQKAPWDFIKESGYSYKVAGENLAKGYATPQGITKAWVNSPTHHANMVSRKYQEVGFACIEIVDESGSKVLYTVQMFGSR